MGERGRNEFDEAFKRAGVTAQVSGQGSLMRIHLTDRPMNSYQSVYPKPEEADRMRTSSSPVERRYIHCALWLAVSLDGKHMGRCPAFDRHSHRRLSES